MSSSIRGAPLAADVRVGDVLADKYRVERVLGVGGMGVVLQAWHLELEQHVAVKFMLSCVAENAEAVGRFLREARAAAKLQSAHVARVMDVGRLSTGEPYMVMEYLEGQDLSEVLKSSGPLSAADAVDHVLQVCEAIAEAHAQGIIHRDLKPSNLFLTRHADGTALVKVLDFGISKLTNASGDKQAAALTSTRALLGSPAYMSPEQMRSAKLVDVRCDIWALGIILYELLTASSPFDAETLPGMIAAITSDPPRPLRANRPELPEALEAAVLRCIEKDPAARFHDVGELAVALEPFASPDARQSVTRAIRVLRSVGKTKMGTGRPPALSASDASPGAIEAGSVQGTMVTFGVTANSAGRKTLPFVVGGIALALIAAGSVGLWLLGRPMSEEAAAALGESPATSGQVVPDEERAAPDASMGLADARLDEPEPEAVTSGAQVPVANARGEPPATRAIPKARQAPNPTSGTRPPKSTAAVGKGDDIDLSERK